MRRRILWIGLLCAVLIWGAADLFWPRHADLRNFDPHRVAQLETAMWRSYYDRKPLAMYQELGFLLRTQYGFPWLRSQVGAFHAARAAFVFKRGHARADYERALPSLKSFYAMIRRDSNIPFDANEAARRELEWWIIHRERARYGQPALEWSLAELQGSLYRMPPEVFTKHAAARAEAMSIRDRQAERGGVSNQDWERIAALLDQSWSSLHEAVGVTSSRPTPKADSGS